MRHVRLGGLGRCGNLLVYDTSEDPLFPASFFFLECSLKVEVDIIHGRALYTGIYVKV